MFVNCSPKWTEGMVMNTLRKTDIQKARRALKSHWSLLALLRGPACQWLALIIIFRFLCLYPVKGKQNITFYQVT